MADEARRCLNPACRRYLSDEAPANKKFCTPYCARIVQRGLTRTHRDRDGARVVSRLVTDREKSAD